MSIVFTLGVEAFWRAAAARRRGRKNRKKRQRKSYTIIEQEEKIQRVQLREGKREQGATREREEASKLG